jgi:predicted DNA-binding protein (UPF0251 family)
MGRNKIQRACSFKPNFTKFSPCSNPYNGTMELNSDEMEAIFLIDYQGDYQESAATKMNISRPTLSRIIKSARKKIATSLILGYEINIIDNKDKFIIALSVQRKNNFLNLSNTNDLIALVYLANKKIIDINYIDNPLIQKDKKPSQVLPSLLKEHNVHYWISDKIGEGLKNSLLTKGIFTKELKSIKFKKDIANLFCQ